MNKSVFFVLGVVLFSFAPCRSGAQEAASDPMSPVQFSIFDPVQIPSDRFDVYGLRVSLLYGHCQDLIGLDAGLVNRTEGDQIGLAAGLVNYTEGCFTGLQAGGVNLSDAAYSMQIGLYNGAKDMVGMQIGVINHARLLRGIQIGLINVIETSDVSFLPVINFFF